MVKAPAVDSILLKFGRQHNARFDVEKVDAWLRRLASTVPQKLQGGGGRNFLNETILIKITERSEDASLENVFGFLTKFFSKFWIILKAVLIKNILATTA